MVLTILAQFLTIEAMISIEFGADKLPAEGVCYYCGVEIEGEMFKPFIQFTTGDRIEVHYFDVQYCLPCYHKTEDISHEEA